MVLLVMGELWLEVLKEEGEVVEYPDYILGLVELGQVSLGQEGQLVLELLVVVVVVGLAGAGMWVQMYFLQWKRHYLSVFHRTFQCLWKL